jgi:hypothetical protein
MATIPLTDFISQHRDELIGLPGQGGGAIVSTVHPR